MSTENPSVTELGIVFSPNEDQIARESINRYSTGGHPVAADEPTLRAADFVAVFVRDCVHTALSDSSDPMTDEGKALTKSVFAKLSEVPGEPRIVDEAYDKEAEAKPEAKPEEIKADEIKADAPK